MLELVLWFALLSLLSVGGISSVMPEFQRIVVERNAWVTPEQFTQLFAVSQAAPGPNILITSLIGWQVSGPVGAVVALLAMCIPAATLAWYVSALWDRFRDAPWRVIVQKSLAPVTVGLVYAGGYVLATPHGLDWRSAAIAGASALALFFSKINPLWLLAGGGVLGAVLF